MSKWKTANFDKVINMIRHHCPSKYFTIGLAADNRLYIAPAGHVFENNPHILGDSIRLDEIPAYIKAGKFHTEEIFIWVGEQFSTHIFEEEDLANMMADVADENEKLKGQISDIRKKQINEEADLQYIIAEIDKLRDENSNLDTELESARNTIREYQTIVSDTSSENL